MGGVSLSHAVKGSGGAWKLKLRQRGSRWARSIVLTLSSDSHIPALFVCLYSIRPLWKALAQR